MTPKYSDVGMQTKPQEGEYRFSVKIDRLVVGYVISTNIEDAQIAAKANYGPKATIN